MKKLILILVVLSLAQFSGLTQSSQFDNIGTEYWIGYSGVFYGYNNGDGEYGDVGVAMDLSSTIHFEVGARSGNQYAGFFASYGKGSLVYDRWEYIDYIGPYGDNLIPAGNEYESYSILELGVVLRTGRTLFLEGVPSFIILAPEEVDGFGIFAFRAGLGLSLGNRFNISYGYQFSKIDNDKYYWNMNAPYLKAVLRISKNRFPRKYR